MLHNATSSDVQTM